MNKKKLFTAFTAGLIALSMLSGCGKKEEVVEETGDYSINATETSMITDDTNISLSKDGQMISDLTGEWIDEDLAKRKPIAVMVNNIIDAMPQSGVENADVIYEMLEEGGITRLMCLFTDYDDMEKIGPCRSARYYYDRKAVEHQALFVHWGRSVYCLEDFDNYPGIEHVDFNETPGGFRSDDRVAPHNAYVSGKGINDWRASAPYSLEKNENYKKMFAFNLEDTEIEGDAANKITTEYNSGRKPWFEYDADAKVYKRFQYGEAQIDKETNNQLQFKNVLIQFVPHAPYPDDEVGSLVIDFVGKGEGWYATDGKIIPITWEKKEETDVTTFYTKDGNQLKMNPGKTWVSIFPDDNKAGIVVE